MSQPTDKQKQEARELLRACEKRMGIFLGSGSEFNDFAHHVALALSSRDQEIREVLEGLSVLLHIDRNAPQRCWCANQPGYAHTPACLAARVLWERVQS